MGALAFACAVIVSSFQSQGAVAPGENLLINADFSTGQLEFPEFWSPSSDAHVIHEPFGGPKERIPAVVLRGDGSTSDTISLRQQGLCLIEGETYKLSAYVKTVGYQARGGGLVVHNSGWTSATGFTDLPENSNWTLREKEFKLFPSKNGEYGVAMYAVHMTGELHFADLKLEAVSEGAMAGSSSNRSILEAPRLVPIEPLLNRIPRDNPRLRMKLFGDLPNDIQTYECQTALRGDSIPAQGVPLETRDIHVDLSGLPIGDYSLQVHIREAGNGETLVEREYAISVIDFPAVDNSRVTWLNNLVAEVLNVRVERRSEPREFRFVTPRDGWAFFAIRDEHATSNLAVRIDGRDTVITADTDRLEAFRHLNRGEHRLTVTGNSSQARLIVRSIAEIFNYPPCSNSFVAENGAYDWDFMKEHILYAVTTLNGGRLPGVALEEAKARGLRWLDNFNVAPVDDPENVRKRMMQEPGMIDAKYDGITSDELFFGRITIDNYTQALWRLKNPEHRLIYTWIVGKPNISSLHTDFMSACLNASRGRGRLLFEAYCHPQENEAAAAAYLDDKVVDTMRRFKRFFPNAVSGTGIIFGNFNQIPIISLEHDPAVDFKYFLDMQVNLVANNPEFAELATTGYWGTYYGDEELVRWSFKLMRHYAVEGRKQMLSSQYGFRYNPGFLENCDFAAGLDGWTVSAAADGTVRADTIAGYGGEVQRRWGAGSTGDTTCVMTRQPNSSNRISQTARGLDVGKAYCLQFVTADYEDVITGTYNPRRYGLDVELPGVELLGDRSFVHIDRRKRHRRIKPEHLGKANLHRLVFRAVSPTQRIIFSDRKAAPGEELALNFIQLKPYLE